MDTAAALAEERARAALVQRSTIEVIGRLQDSKSDSWSFYMWLVATHVTYPFWCGLSLSLMNLQEQMEDLASKASAYRALAAHQTVFQRCTVVFDRLLDLLIPPQVSKCRVQMYSFAWRVTLSVTAPWGDGSSPFVLSTSYRIPKTPLQFVSRYEQGRANIMLTLTPDKEPWNDLECWCVFFLHKFLAELVVILRRAHWDSQRHCLPFCASYTLSFFSHLITLS